jgi:hypothetical protein
VVGVNSLIPMDFQAWVDWWAGSGPGAAERALPVVATDEAATKT